MASANKHRATIGRVFGQLHRDEKGTTITEFVSTLPIFILIFGGMLHLAKLERESFRIKAKAAKATWEASMDVAEGGIVPNFDHQSPVLAGANSLSILSNQDTSLATFYDMRGRLGLMSSGPRGEMRGSVRILSLTKPNAPSTSKQPNYTTIKNQHARRLLEERNSRSVTTSNGLSVYSLASTLSRIPLVENPTFSAGMRYGMVEGEHQETVTIGGINYDMGQRYNMMVSPVPSDGLVGENITTGFSRLGAEKESCFNKILGLNRKMNYMKKCRGFSKTSGSGMATTGGGGGGGSTGATP